MPPSDPGATIVTEGRRVGLLLLNSVRRDCAYGLPRWEAVFAKAPLGGYTKHGGFAEYILADPDYVAGVPGDLTGGDAAPIICASITTYKGSRRPKRNPVNGSPSPVAAAVVNQL